MSPVPAHSWLAVFSCGRFCGVGIRRARAIVARYATSPIALTNRDEKPGRRVVGSGAVALEHERSQCVGGECSSSRSLARMSQRLSPS